MQSFTYINICICSSNFLYGELINEIYMLLYTHTCYLLPSYASKKVEPSFVIYLIACHSFQRLLGLEHFPILFEFSYVKLDVESLLE